MNTAPITVAISTLDRPDAVEACLAGLLSAERVPFEIVVVDQSTTDATRAVVERASSGACEVVYVRHRGRGLAVSQNLAVEQARGEIVAVIDDDCVPAPDWLRQIERAFASPSHLDLVTGRVLPLGPPHPDLYPVSSRTSTRRMDFAGRVAPWRVGSGNNFAVRRTSFLRIGGCDERLGPGAPGKGGVDMDLFYRLLRSGGRGRYEPAAVVYHEQKPREERMARRPLYGYGTGACFALWTRRGDVGGPVMLVRWLAWRSARMAKAVARGAWTNVQEEALMLGWTFAGLGFGLRVPEIAPPSSTND